MEIIDYTRELIPAVMDFERRLRAEEPFYSWDIDEAYQKRMEASLTIPAMPTPSPCWPWRTAGWWAASTAR